MALLAKLWKQKKKQIKNSKKNFSLKVNTKYNENRKASMEI